jgi:hypothetical protein
MTPTLHRLPRPHGRLNFVQMKLLAELSARSDGDGLVETAKARDLIDYTESLLRSGHILLSGSHVAVTSRLSAALKREKDRNRRRQSFKAPADWSLTRKVGEVFPALAITSPAALKISRARYTILLARALQIERMSPQAHSLLTYLATAQAEGKPATITQAMEDLGCTYNAIVHHVGRSKGEPGSNVHLFHVNREKVPMVIEISEEGIAVLRKVDALVQRHAASACASSNS